MIFNGTTQIPQLAADDTQIAKVFVGEDLVYLSESYYLVLNTSQSSAADYVTVGGVSIFSNTKNVLTFGTKTVAVQYTPDSITGVSVSVVVDGTQVHSNWYWDADTDGEERTTSFSWTPTAHKYNVTYADATNAASNHEYSYIRTITLTFTEVS